MKRSVIVFYFVLAVAVQGETAPWFIGQLDVLQDKVDRYERDPDPDPVGQIQSRVEFGDALLVTRAYEKAISLASWGVDSRHDAVRDLRTAHALALVHTLPFGEVDGFYRQLHGSALNAYPPEHPVLARILDRWVVIKVANGKYDEAMDHVRQSLRIKEKAFGLQHPFVADGLAMLASLEYAHGDRDLVEALLQRMLAIRTAAFGEAHPLTQTAIMNLREK